MTTFHCRNQHWLLMYGTDSADKGGCVLCYFTLARLTRQGVLGGFSWLRGKPWR